MSSTQITDDPLNPVNSEPQFLLFTGKKEELDSFVHAINIDMLAPLLVGMAAAVIFVILYAFLLGKLG
jgi:hypothetical protein